MKKRNIFLIIFLVLIFGLGAFNTFAAPRFINENTMDNIQNERLRNVEDEQTYEWFFASELIKNEGVLHFIKDKNELADYEIEVLENVYDDYYLEINRLERDPNFNYQIINGTTGKIVSQSYNLPTEEGSSIYVEKDLKASDNYLYSSLQMKLNNVLLGTIGREVELNLSDSYQIVYSIPSELVLSDSSYIRDMMLGSQQEYFMIYAVGLAIISGLLTCVFMLFAPMSSEEEVQPFKMISKWKFEINFIIFISLIALAGAGCVYYFGLVQSGIAYSVLSEVVSIPNLEIFLDIGAVVLWAAFNLVVACLMFAIKRFFTNGFAKSFKENTIVGWIVTKISNAFKQLGKLDFEEPASKKLVLIVIINFIVLLICASLFGLGILFAIIYSIAAFIYLDKKLRQIELDHTVVRNELQVLAKGDFSMDFNADVGVFNVLQSELRNVRTGFEMAVEEETKSQNMKTELITNVSHDLKTPVTCIKNYVELLNGEESTVEERIEYLKNIEHYTNRLEHLIEDLFDISKASSGNIQLELEEIPITELIDQVVIELEEQLDSRELEVVTNYNIDTGILKLDGSKSYRLFENLIMNVCKYSLERTRVYIDVVESDNTVQVIIKNISKTQLDFDTDRIKERFSRGDSSRHENGSGLGLAIVDSFVELQNGSFDVEIDGDLFKAILTFKK